MEIRTGENGSFGASGSPKSDDVLISCRDLGVGYGGREILSGINFDVAAGDYICVVGENGAGKSTLIRTILGLCPPISGEIIFRGGLRRDDIGYLPQQTNVQGDFPATVTEIVMSGFQGRCGLRPFYTREERRGAAQNMERMGISGIAKRCCRELSGGQRQRVFLARALCAARRVLIVDEPDASLDPQASSDMYSLTDDLNRDGLTVIMISHDIDAVFPHAVRFLRIRAASDGGMSGSAVLSSGGE